MFHFLSPSTKRRITSGETRPPCPPEFRAEAVRLYRTSGKSQAQIARELGVSSPTLAHWLKQDAIDNGKADGLTTSERAELHSLRKEVNLLRQERAILKKAAAFFARELGPR